MKSFYECNFSGTTASSTGVKYLRTNIDESDIKYILSVEAEKLAGSEDAFEAARIGIAAVLKYIGIG